MRHPTVTVLVLAMLAACGQDDPAPAPPADTPSAPSGVPRAPTPAEPDLAACPKAEDPEVRIRTGPVPVPAPFAAIAVSSMDHFAFTTLAGNTICVDTTWIESADDAELSDDGRFASFNWIGYEAFGHVIVDRTGDGQVIDTGNAPHRSPDGRRLAAIDLSESGFGSLNAFAVWDIEPVGLRQAAEITEGFPTGDWRIEGWQGERCVRLSLVPIDRYPEDHRDMERTPRDPWFAAQSAGWTPAAGSCPRS